MTIRNEDEERAAFEEAAFGAYFLSTIVQNPNPRGMRLISTADMTKAEFCRRAPDGRYETDTVESAWWGWCKAIERRSNR